METPLQNQATAFSSLSDEEFIQVANRQPYLSVDTETNGEDIRDGRGFIRGLSIAYELPGVCRLSRYFPLRHGDGDINVTLECRTELDKLFASYEGTMFFHNFKFDYESLKTGGWDYQGRFIDTMLLAHLINENTPVAKSLDACAKYYLKDEGKLKSEQFTKWIKAHGWANVPISLIQDYAEYDADLTLRLGMYLIDKARPEKLMDYWPHKEKFLRLIISMESWGVRIDQDLCRMQTNLGEHAMSEVLDILGYDNLGPKAYKELLIDKMKLPEIINPKTERITFDKTAMARYEEILLRSDDPTAGYILEYRGWQKSVSSNYRAYLDLLSPDGRLRPNYKLHGTRTGRMSCEKPNLQQIPRVSDKPWNGKLKSTFVADDGYTLWEADYSQLELRLATAYAGEEGLKEVFLQGRDIFTEMSQQLGMTRQDTKTMTYTIQYGGGIRRLVEVFGVTETRARYLMDNFYQTYPGFRRVSDNAKKQTQAYGKVRIWSGRYRHFFFGKEEAHKAFNAVMQGGAADIMEHTMLRVADAVGWANPDCRMLLQVHDSIVFEIKQGMESIYHPQIREAMENIEPNFGVRFAVDLHQWGKG